MGESTLIALSMRLTSIAAFLAALTVQANVGINIKSDNTEEAPETGSTDAPCAQVRNNCGTACCDGLECVDYSPTFLPSMCQKCAEMGDKCHPENRRLPRCCDGLECRMTCVP